MKPKHLGIISSGKKDLQEIVFIPTTSDWVRLTGEVIPSGSSLRKTTFTSNWFNTGGFLPLDACVSDFDYRFRILENSTNSSQAIMVGLATEIVFGDYRDLIWSIDQRKTTCYIRLNGDIVLTLGGAQNDSRFFRIRRVNGVVDILDNDVSVYTFAGTFNQAVAPQISINRTMGAYNNQLTYLG